MTDLYAFLIVAGLVAIANIVCGGHTAFDFKEVRAYVHSFFLVVIGFFSLIIIARSDSPLSNHFDWDGEAKLLVLGAMVAGLGIGIVVTFIFDYVAEEVARRKMMQQTKRPPFPTPASQIKLAPQDPRITRSDQYRQLDTLA